ncbi:MAG TPA: hypothetical protein PLE85_10920 [Bacteroidales bacterium]|jgi:hypothetical protein|nr:hypothetical protein [Lentimicrobiaceae bacterium]HOI01035.1 hypothetical protein [Bacteroidales bacterium]
MNFQIQHLLAAADIWEELGDDGYYLGFVQRGSNHETLSAQQMKICLITPKAEGIQMKLWANGDNLYFNYRWDQRAAYPYKFAQ